MNTFKNCLWKLVVIAVVLMMVISGISNARSVYAVNENTQQTIANQNETAPQTSEDTTQENAKDGASGTSVSASENEKAEEKTDADQSTGLDPPAATENKTDSVEMPEASFTASTDKLTISVTALANTFPKGTKMDAKEISASDAKSIAKEKLNSIDEAVGADITFSYEGKEIEPANDKNVTVKMTLKNEMDGKNFQVLHKKDSGDIEKMTAEVSGKKAVFKAKSFSIYVITSENVDTYKFYDGNKQLMDTYTQKITSGEKLDQPNAPEKEGYKFIGWSKNEKATEADFDFDKLPAAADGTTYNIYAVFKEVHYVFFMAGAKGEDATKVASTKEGIKGDTISADDISKVKLGLASNQSIEGWYYDQKLTNKAEDVTIDTENIYLYPNIQTGNYITFDSDGGTYFEPRFVNAGTSVEEKDMPTPNKKGYKFLYWSTAKSGNEYEYGHTLDKDIKLYAVYEAAETNYTVVFWQQSLNDKFNTLDKDKTYEVESTVSLKAKTGEKIRLQNVTTVSNYRNRYERGFTYNATKSEVEKTITADGKTVFNVYYDRKVVTFKFNYPDNSVEYSDSSVQKVHKGLYGQKLDFTWPTYYTVKKKWYGRLYTLEYNNCNWKHRDTNITTTLITTYISPGTDRLEDVFDYTKTGEATIRFYKESLKGEDILADVSHATGGTYYINDKYNGFTPVRYTTDYGFPTSGDLKEKDENGYYAAVKYNSSLDIYFKRNSYNLSFYNYNKVDKSESIKYEASLKDKNYYPNRPDGLDEEYQFKGWYKDKAYTTEFDFNTTMPAHGITLYAKWEAPNVNVKVHGLDDGKTQAFNDLSFRSKIDINNLPTVKDSDGTVVAGNKDYTYTVPSGSHWVGWATKDDNGNYTLFNFDTELKKDLNLYPYVIDSNKYVVSYDLNNGKGTTVTDDKKYALNSFADVKSANGITPPDGTMFLNWQIYDVKDGKSTPTGEYRYPGDKLKMTGDKLLKANYVPIPQKVSLVYHANNGTNTPELKHTVNGNTQFDNNDQITLYDGSKYFKAPTNKEGLEAVFDSWNTNKDGSGTTSFEAGQKVGINKIGTDKGKNELYAQWKYVADLTISNSVTGNQGDKTKYFAFNVVIKNVKANTEYTLDTTNATDTRNPSGVKVKAKANANGEINKTIYLKDKESITFEDVNITKEDATYRVTETQETGYKTTYKIDGGAEETGVDTFTKGFKKGHTVAFTNIEWQCSNWYTK